MTDQIDAKRYRYIRDNLTKSGPKMDGQHYYFFKNSYLKERANTFDEAIDKMIEKTEKERLEYLDYVKHRAKSN